MYIYIYTRTTRALRARLSSSRAHGTRITSCYCPIVGCKGDYSQTLLLDARHMPTIHLAIPLFPYEPVPITVVTVISLPMLIMPRLCYFSTVAPASSFSFPDRARFVGLEIFAKILDNPCCVELLRCLRCNGIASAERGGPPPAKGGWI